MKRITLVSVLLMGIAACMPASATTITLTPSSGSLLLFGPDNGQNLIDAAINAAYPGLDLLYKGTRSGTLAAGISSEPFADSYSTTFFNSDLADADARITYLSGEPAINSNPVYALIKDGNADPNWYFFSLSGWNGTDTIDFESFFQQTTTTSYNVSHVAIYGNHVPDGGATAALLGLGMLALGFVRRRR